MPSSIEDYVEKKRKRLKLLILTALFSLVPVFWLSLYLGSSGPLPMWRWHLDDPIFQLRIYRTLTAFFSAASLALNGLLLQNLLANPLIDSSILGISSGSTLGMLTGYIISAKLGLYIAPIVSLIFSLATMMLVYGLSKMGGFRILVVALSGVMVSTMLTSISYLLILVNPAISKGGVALVLGSLGYSDTWSVYLSLASFSVIAGHQMLRVGNIRKILLGEDLARASGINVERIRKESLIVSSLSISLVTLSVGPIGFIGLIIPHISRIAVGGDPGACSITSTLWGPVLLICADIISRVAFMPSELPVGITMSIIGAPFFLFLLIKSMRR
uniref:Iron ABC transporter permease n=1 Tax=Fervidicoccus fontis TaxID=683846 RepID=A0A7J3SM32_9CREN